MIGTSKTNAFKTPKISLIVSGLFLLCVVIGFGVVSYLLKTQLEEQFPGLFVAARPTESD